MEHVFGNKDAVISDCQFEWKTIAESLWAVAQFNVLLSNLVSFAGMRTGTHRGVGEGASASGCVHRQSSSHSAEID